MSLDAEIRQALEAEVEHVHASPSSALESVRHSARRKRIQAAGIAVAASVGLILAGLLVVPRLADLTGEKERVAAPQVFSREESGPLYDAIAGTYRIEVTESRSYIGNRNLDGEWTLRLTPDGRVLVARPRRAGAAFYGGFYGIAYQGEGRTVEFLNLFSAGHCRGAGRFTFDSTPSGLSFAPVGNVCPLQEALVASAAWQRVSSE